MNFPEVSGIGFWYTDFVTGKGFWSKELYRIHGMPADCVEPAVDLFMKHVHIDSLDLVSDAVHDGTRTLKPFSCFHKSLTLDKSLRNLFTMGDFDFALNEKPAHRYGITLDLTGLPEGKLIEATERAKTLTLPGLATLADANLCKPFIGICQQIISE